MFKKLLLASYALFGSANGATFGSGPSKEVMLENIHKLLGAWNDLDACPELLKQAVPKGFMWYPKMMGPEAAVGPDVEMCAQLKPMMVGLKANIALTGEIKFASEAKVATVPHVWHIESEDGHCKETVPGFLKFAFTDDGKVAEGYCVDDLARFNKCGDYVKTEFLRGHYKNFVDKIHMATSTPERMEKCEAVLGEAAAKDLEWLALMGPCKDISCFCGYARGMYKMGAKALAMVPYGELGFNVPQNMVFGQHIWHVEFEDCALDMHGSHYSFFDDNGIMIKGECVDELDAMAKCSPPKRREL